MARLAIRMPKMSMTMTEGDVSEWKVKVGDAVGEGDVVCEVMTDKVEMEVESTVSGTLVEIVVESGSVQVGEPIGWVEGEDTGGGFGDLLAAPTDPADLPAAAAEDVEQPTPAPIPEPVDTSPPPTAGPVAAVPRARGLARARGIDLRTVAGTGPDGVIRVGDIEALTPAPTPTAGQPLVATPVASRPSKAADRTAAIRSAVARKMTPSTAIPQFTVWRTIELDAANTKRRGLSWTTILLRAYAGALREVPDLLCRWEDDAASEAGPPAIALAVATDRGLLVPTFTEPDRDSAEDVDQEIRSVVSAARAGKLDPSYLGTANASLSNLGGMGVDRFQALLTPPQASVLSLGSIRHRPVAVPGGLGVALTVEVGLTVDHRVADGAHAAELLEQFVRRISGVV
jgi:pyruvate dehydrogenase E2 component (dihydrolipoamide acetyltransferase)